MLDTCEILDFLLLLPKQKLIHIAHADKTILLKEYKTTHMHFETTHTHSETSETHSYHLEVTHHVLECFHSDFFYVNHWEESLLKATQKNTYFRFTPKNEHQGDLKDKSVSHKTYILY